MTILFIDGFDTYNHHSDGENGAGVAYDMYFAGGDTAMSSDSLMDSGRGSSISATTSGTPIITYERAVTASSTLCASIVFRTTYSNFVLSRILGVGNSIYNTASNYSTGAVVSTDSAGQITFIGLPSSQVIYTGIYIAANQDYHFEIETLSDGTANLYVMGSLAATLDMGNTAQLDHAGFLGYFGSSGGQTKVVTLDHFIVADSRIGPAIVKVVTPISDGVTGGDFSPTPVDWPRYQTVYDALHAIGTDLDTSHIEGNVSGATQTFFPDIASDDVLEGEALAYTFSSCSKTVNPSPYRIETFMVNNGNTDELGYYIPKTGIYETVRSGVRESLPGGLPLTLTNFQATEIGVRLIKF